MVTGADGFLGWHTRSALRARGIHEVVTVGHMLASDPTQLDHAIAGTEAVLHLAGVNRADGPALSQGNFLAALQLTESLDRVGARPTVVYANSIQSGGESPFGEGKGAAADHLRAWGRRAGAPVSDVRLPNLFGEHGRPHYNSVVATFCYELVNDGQPVVHDDRLVTLMHAQDAVDLMLDLVDRRADGIYRPEGDPIMVSALLDKLRGFRYLYRAGDIPDLTSRVDRALFNTYRSHCFPARYPIYPPLRSDSRGDLFECVRALGGQTQVFCSSTRPAITRGEHFHLRKVERFLVLRGIAVIALRRLFDHAIVRFEVSGALPAIVDMPTMWTHSITNTGTDDLVTMFWADEILDPQATDTFPELVNLGMA